MNYGIHTKGIKKLIQNTASDGTGGVQAEDQLTCFEKRGQKCQKHNRNQAFYRHRHCPEDERPIIKRGEQAAHEQISTNTADRSLRLQPRAHILFHSLVSAAMHVGSRYNAAKSAMS